MSHIKKLVNSIVNYVKKKTLPKIIIFIAFNALSPYKLYTFDNCHNERGQGAALIYIDNPLFETEPCSPLLFTRIKIRSIEGCLKNFYRKCGFYPSTDDGFQALKSKPKGRSCKEYNLGGFIEAEEDFTDIWFTPLRYELVSGKPNIISAGKDREFGTSDDISLIEINKSKHPKARK
jgi:hypothetical protein